MLLQIIFKFRGSETPFPALSTGHFNKYERKCKWLEHILPISSVVVKVQCSRKKGKTAIMSASLLVSSDSLAKGETFTLQTGQKTPTQCEKFISYLCLMIKTLSGNQYICTKTSSQISAVRTGVCAFVNASPWILVDQSKLDPVHASIIVLFSSEEMGVRLSSICVLF